MSYTYNNSKSNNICCNFENQEDVYVFNIKIITFDDNIIKKNIISLDKIGDLMECENNIKKFKITFCLLNSNLCEKIILKKNFINEIDETITLFKKKLFVNIIPIDNNISINYKIN